MLLHHCTESTFTEAKTVRETKTPLLWN